MTKKILIPAFLIVSSLVLSACDLKYQSNQSNPGSQATGAQNQTVREVNSTPSPVPTVVATQTSEQLLDQLNQDKDPVLDDQFKEMQKEF